MIIYDVMDGGDEEGGDDMGGDDENPQMQKKWKTFS